MTDHENICFSTISKSDTVAERCLKASVQISNRSGGGAAGVWEVCRLNCGSRALLASCMSQEHASAVALRGGTAQDSELPPHSLGATTGLVSDSCTALDSTEPEHSEEAGRRKVWCAEGDLQNLEVA